MKGIIYMIRPKIDHDPSHVYYGSTVTNQRYNQHRQEYDTWMTTKDASYTSSFKVFMKYGFDNCEFVVLEEFDDITKSDLRYKEYSYIVKNPCVNVLVNSVTQAENTEAYIEKMNALTTKDIPVKKKSKTSIRYETDEAFREKMKKLSREKIDNNPHLSESHRCDCGGRYSIQHLKTHFQSQRHQRFNQNIGTASLVPTL